MVFIESDWEAGGSDMIPTFDCCSSRGCHELSMDRTGSLNVVKDWLSMDGRIREIYNFLHVTVKVKNTARYKELESNFQLP